MHAHPRSRVPVVTGLLFFTLGVLVLVLKSGMAAAPSAATLGRVVVQQLNRMPGYEVGAGFCYDAPCCYCGPLRGRESGLRGSLIVRGGKSHYWMGMERPTETRGRSRTYTAAATATGPPVGSHACQDKRGSRAGSLTLSGAPGQADAGQGARRDAGGWWGVDRGPAHSHCRFRCLTRLGRTAGAGAGTHRLFVPRRLAAGAAAVVQEQLFPLG